MVLMRGTVEAPNTDRIAVGDAQAFVAWASHLGVSERELRMAIIRVGTYAQAVRRELTGQRRGKGPVVETSNNVSTESLLLAKVQCRDAWQPTVATQRWRGSRLARQPGHPTA